MSVFCTVMSDSVGLLWRAASGTVDPWTKNCLIETEKAQLITAGCPCPCKANATANQDVSQTLTYNTADPSQFSEGLKKTLGNTLCFTNHLGKSVLFLAVAAVILYLFFIYLFVRR